VTVGTARAGVLIGVAEYLGQDTLAGVQEFLGAVGSMVAIGLGVLCGYPLYRSMARTVGWVVRLEHHLAGSGHRFRDLGHPQPLGRRRSTMIASARLLLGARRCGATAHHAGSRSPRLDDTDQTAGARIRALLGRRAAGGPVPLVVFDAGHDSASSPSP
jgi:hypothetical protein